MTQYDVVISPDTEFLEFLLKTNEVDESVDWFESWELAKKFLKGKRVISTLEIKLPFVLKCKNYSYAFESQPEEYGIIGPVSVINYKEVFTSKFATALDKKGLTNLEASLLANKSQAAISLARSRGIKRKKSATDYAEALSIPVEEILELK